ncbi:MAG: glycosyltransferase family 1 protein [Pseudomonadota bacterium]
MDQLILDISRSVLRASHSAPTGIDRVERAYFQWALDQTDRKVAFLCRIYGWQGVLDRSMAARYFEESARTLDAPEGHPETLWRRRIRQATSRALAAVRSRISFRTKYLGRAAFWRVGVDPRRATYLNVSHSNTQLSTFRLLRALGVPKVAAFVHDVIPLDHPEFFRPASLPGFRRRFEAIGRHADGLIFNSKATEERAMDYVSRWTKQRGRPKPQTMVAHLGIAERLLDPGPVEAFDSFQERPYFVTLGTIEPRKNHMLLLNIWRRLSERPGPAPHLHIVGWRGWENENVLDVLDRSKMAGVTVFEHCNASDWEVLRLLKGARAVLYPSFVEGYGMPIVEAMTLGAPVICSDIPVFREVAGDAPEYLDPLDGPGWEAMIRRYAEPNSRERAVQIARLAGYRPMTWCAHFDRVGPFLSNL